MKSLHEYRDVRMDRNIIRAVEEQSNPTELEIEEATARLEFSKLNPPAGWPLNIIVSISVATTIKELAVFLIPSSPSFLNCSCSFSKNSFP